MYNGEKVAALNLPAWIGLSDDNYVWLSGSHGGKEAEEAVDRAHQWRLHSLQSQ